MSETGNISIHAENILPIIKRWLYSEKEIFLRELIANAADATLKLQKLALIGEAACELPEAEIKVAIDHEKGQLVISDSGLGMTADEVKRYINQVAFSGVNDFLEKYKDKDDSQQVIGHFGLGFYSAFMVSSKVEIETLSHKPGAEPAHWSCDGSTQFTLEKGTRTAIGTSIYLTIAEDSKEMLDEGTIRMLLMRYCAFVRYPINLVEKSGAAKLVNDPKPLWTKTPSSVSDKEYLDFFHQLFPQSPDPLFWIHLNVDHPFNLKGILYFPKLKHELDASQGEVKLFCNQVYVADNVKELVPEFLTLLKGVIDCLDLPLNVSRSYLQSDPTVRKIAEHITKKVADKLSGLAKTERESYEKYWDDIHPFVKYGMLRDAKFFDRMKDHLIFKSSAGGHVTLEAYAERMKDKVEAGTVLYATDPSAQAGYLRMLAEHGMEAVIADTMIDLHFMPYYEMQTARKYHFKRVDADLSKHLVDQDAASGVVIDAAEGATAQQKIEKLFRDHLKREKVKIRVESLKSDKVPAMLIVDESLRRFRDMAKNGGPNSMYAGMGGEPEQTLVVNQKSPAVKGLLKMAMSFGKEEEVGLVVNQIHDLAWLQQGELTAEMMQQFIDRSTAILGRLGGEKSNA